MSSQSLRFVFANHHRHRAHPWVLFQFLFKIPAGGMGVNHYTVSYDKEVPLIFKLQQLWKGVSMILSKAVGQFVMGH